MADAAFLEHLEHRRARARQLRAELEPRWQDERRQLAALEARREASHAAGAAAQEETVRLDERVPALHEELARLERGLSAARMVWVRLFEPLLLSAVLFLGLLSFGLVSQPRRALGLSLAAAVGGAAVSVVSRRRRGG